MVASLTSSPPTRWCIVFSFFFFYPSWRHIVCASVLHTLSPLCGEHHRTYTAGTVRICVGTHHNHKCSMRRRDNWERKWKQNKKGADRGRATTQFQAATSRSFEELLLAGVQWQPHRCCHCLFSPAAQRNEPFCADDEHNNIRIRKLLSFPHFLFCFLFFVAGYLFVFLRVYYAFILYLVWFRFRFFLFHRLFIYSKSIASAEREKRKTTASLIATPGSSSKRAVVKVSLKWSY